MLDPDVFTHLHGSSQDKVRTLLETVRKTKVGGALTLIERLPFGLGESVRYILHDVPDLPAPAIDALLQSVSDALLTLKSDDTHALIEGEATC
jgi:hypothetical protein